MSSKRKLFFTTAGIAAILLFIFGLWALWTVAKMAKELPNPEDFTTRRITQSTKIYNRTGETLLYEVHGDERRTVIPYDQIPLQVKQATLAAEDQDFYKHQAVSFKGMARAILVDIVRGRVVQGGSTITQQLARNAFLTADRTISRKLKEVILAYWIEKQYSKDEILNLYLNQIPYGGNAYGIEAASQSYFGKPAKDVNLAEAATLAALIKGPTYYSPWGNHQDQLKTRRGLVLGQMEELGFITKDEKLGALNAKLSFLPPGTGGMRAPHFVMMVRDYLDLKYGEGLVERGGLKVYTTLDMRLQEIAERTVEEGAARNTELYNGRNAALVAQDPKTGQILALVGSKNYFGKAEPAGCTPQVNCQFEGNFNVAADGERQPGSSIKPFAYITAFQEGYTPDTTVFDLPTEFSKSADCPVTGINYKKKTPGCFHPENYDLKFRGPINLRNSLAQSINVSSVKVLYLAGLDNVLLTAQNFGIKTLEDRNRYGLSLVLGGGEVRLIEMVNGYSVFSQEGTRHDQSIILKVEDSKGDILEEYTDRAVQVIEPQYARLLNDILTDVNARAPLFGGSSDLTTFQDREVALKTGTTNDYRDAWALGYTPSLAVGVWAGNNDNRVMQKHAGSILAAVPIWSAFLKEALPLYPEEGFNNPDPTIAQKPMLNGQYAVNREMHDILYWVNKNDPMGPIPSSPGDDPQFSNWEAPVALWAQSAAGQEFIARFTEIQDPKQEQSASSTPTSTVGL